MKKIVLSLLAIGAFSICSATDIRHGVAIDVGAAVYSVDYSGGDFSSKSTFGDSDGVELGVDFIVNDGLLFGNANYMKIKYSSMDGDSSLKSNPSLSGVTSSIENYSVEFTEMEYKRSHEYYVGLIAGSKNVILSTPSSTQDYSWMDIGVSSGYIKFFGRFGVGVEGVASLALNPTLKGVNLGVSSNSDLGTSYYYSASLPLVYKMGDSMSLYLKTSYESYSLGAPKDGVLFTGGSSFNSWKSLVGFKMMIK